MAKANQQKALAYKLKNWTSLKINDLHLERNANDKSRPNNMIELADLILEKFNHNLEKSSAVAITSNNKEDHFMVIDMDARKSFSIYIK